MFIANNFASLPFMFKSIFNSLRLIKVLLTHWGQVMHVCINNLTIICSHSGGSPGRCQAIIWTNARILLIGPVGINFSEVSIEIQIFSFKKIHLRVSSAK